MSGSRVLVTNDDGVRAPGLFALATALVEAGFDVTVAAPLDDRSGGGAAIGPVHLGDGIDYERVELDGLAEVPAFGIDGPPALAVMLARLGAFGEPPDIVASGINEGNNTGRAVLHSGTVGAALTAAGFGASGVAISAALGDPIRYDTAAAIAVDVVAWLARVESPMILNVNVPDRAMDDVQGVRQASLAQFGTFRAAVSGVGHDRFQLEFTATGAQLEPDSDTALVRDGFVAVSRLVSIRAEPIDGLAEALDGLVAARV